MSYLAHCRTTRLPEVTNIAQQNHKEDLGLQFTRSVSLCLCVCTWLKCDLVLIIRLQGAADLFISPASEASPCCHRDDYGS